MAMQKRAIETREKIVAAAAQVFSEMSFAEASMADILKLAGVTQGSLYFHFDSKTDLAYEVVRRQHEKAYSLGSARLNSEASAAENLVGISYDLATALMNEPVMRAGLRLVTESINVFVKPVVKPYVDWIEICKVLLQRAVENGETKKPLDIDSASVVVISSFTGTHVVASALGALPELLERLDRMWELLLPSLGLENPAKPARS